YRLLGGVPGRLLPPGRAEFLPGPLQDSQSGGGTLLGPADGRTARRTVPTPHVSGHEGPASRVDREGKMSQLPSASIVINNYNYGRFLREAITSALNQTPSGVEIIVVDDGSLDDSREVIAAFGERVIPVLKENGGQASALNAGFRASRG